MNTLTPVLNPEDPQTIHSSCNLPLNIAKNPTRISLDVKNQLLIKKIYRKPSNANLAIYQTNLNNSEKKYISTASTTNEKTLKTQETQGDEKYPFIINEILIKKKTKHNSIFLDRKNTIDKSPLVDNRKPNSPEIKFRFRSFDTKKSNYLAQSTKKPAEDPKIDETPSANYFFNANYIQKKNWFAYPKTANATLPRNKRNNSFIQKNINSPSSLTQSIVSSPKKIKNERSSFNPIRKTPQAKTIINKRQLTENMMQNSGKISRLFENNFVENLNNMVSNPEIPLPPLDLKIQQTDLKNAERQKLLDFNENQRNEYVLLVKKIEEKFQKLIREEILLQEWESQNVDKDSFTRVADHYITETELQLLVKEYSRLEDKDLEKIDKIAKRIKFFSKFQKPIRYRLLKISTLVKKSANEILFRQGDFGDLLYVILKGSVNVIVNRRNRDGEMTETIVASLYDGSNFGELAMMGANRNTKELKIDLMSQIVTKSDISKFIKKEEEEKELEEKQKQLKEVQDLNQKDKIYKKIIEKLEAEIKQTVAAKIKEGQRRLATIKVQESSYMLVIPRNEFKSILLSLFQVDFEFKLKVLKKISFFKECDAASLIPFASYLNIKTFRMGEVILREGSSLNEFYIVAQGRCKTLKEVLVDRVVKPSNFTRRMNEPLKNFHFGIQNSEDSSMDDKRDSWVKEKDIKEDLNLSLKLFPFQVQSKDSSEKIQYLEFIEYKNLLEGEFFGGRCLLALDPVLGKNFKNYNTKLTVIAESVEVTLFSLPNYLLQFVPDYIKKILIRNLAITKEYDDFDIEEDLQDFRRWARIKAHHTHEIIEQMGKSRVGDQFYKKY